MLGTIKSSTEISYLFTHGRRFNASNLTIIISKNLQHDHEGRVVFIAGKKLGNAVWRNTAKRRLRALSKDLGGPWSDYDVIFLAKKGINRATYSKVLCECCDLIKKAITSF